MRRSALSALAAFLLLSTGLVLNAPTAGATPVTADAPAQSTQAASGAQGTQEAPRPEAAADPAGGQYVPMRARVLDNVAVEPGATLTVKPAGTAGLPAVGLDSVAVNVAAKGDSGSGTVVVHPSGELEPDAAGVSYDKAHYASTTLVTKVGSDGQVKVVNQGTANVRVYLDVQGYTLRQDDSRGSSYVALPPQRILTPTSLNGGGNLELKPLGKGGVPTTDVTAVALTVTAKSGSVASPVPPAPLSVPACARCPRPGSPRSW